MSRIFTVLVFSLLMIGFGAPFMFAQIVVAKNETRVATFIHRHSHVFSRQAQVLPEEPIGMPEETTLVSAVRILELKAYGNSTVLKSDHEALLKFVRIVRDLDWRSVQKAVWQQREGKGLYSQFTHLGLLDEVYEISMKILVISDQDCARRAEFFEDYWRQWQEAAQEPCEKLASRLGNESFAERYGNVRGCVERQLAQRMEQYLFAQAYVNKVAGAERVNKCTVAKK